MNKIVTRSSIAIIFLCFCIGVYKCGELHWNWYKKKFAAVETKPKIDSNGIFLLFCFGRDIAKKTFSICEEHVLKSKSLHIFYLFIRFPFILDKVVLINFDTSISVC